MHRVAEKAAATAFQPLAKGHRHEGPHLVQIFGEDMDITIDYPRPRFGMMPIRLHLGCRFGNQRRYSIYCHCLILSQVNAPRRTLAAVSPAAMRGCQSTVNGRQSSVLNFTRFCPMCKV